MTLIDRLTAVLQEIGSDIKTLYSLVLSRQNIVLSNIPDEHSFTHALNSVTLFVQFFDQDGYPAPNISYEFIDFYTIKVYLPILDDLEPPTFTGSVFLIKRN